MENYRTRSGPLRNMGGLTLIEMLVVITIFGVVMAGLYSAYTVQLKQAITEYKLSQSEMEFQIAKNLIERDLAMAGFGMAEDYSGLFSPIPKIIEATDGGSGAADTLTLRGTALGRSSRASQAWSYTSSPTPTTTAGFKSWNDSRETPRAGDRIIYIEPNLKKLMAMDASQGQQVNGDTGKYWLFPYPGTSSQSPFPNPLDLGVVAFGLQTAPDNISNHADFPYYEVAYSLSAGNIPYCAEGAKSLLRSENRKSPGDPGQPIMNCVLDFEVAFGLDTDEKGVIDCWDNGGAKELAGYTPRVFRTRLKQIKTFVLVQQGTRDANYLYTGTDPGLGPNQVRVGDALLTACGGGWAGRTVTLTDAQRQYRWKVISMSVSPRNIR